MFPGKKNLTKKQEWLDNACHNLKHTPGTPLHLLNELKSFLETNTASADEREQLQKTITYLENNKHMMNYPEAVSENLPIGSGVTEAACKVIVKQRLWDEMERAWCCSCTESALIVLHHETVIPVLEKN